MKKLFLIILLLIISGSCISTKYVSRYRQTYSENQKEELIQDIYKSEWTLNVDSIPFENWITSQAETEGGWKIERGYILKDELDHEFLIIYTTFIEKDTTYYEFEILERGKYKFKK